MRYFILGLLMAAFLAAAGCGSKGDTETSPRKVALNMLRAMETSDREKLAHYLDFPSLLLPGNRDYALKMDSVRAFRTPDDILNDLSQGGLTHERWLSMQRIVAADSITPGGDTAFVEVSFVSKETNTQFYNRWGLRKANGIWKIFSFSVMPAR